MFPVSQVNSLPIGIHRKLCQSRISSSPFLGKWTTAKRAQAFLFYLPLVTSHSGDKIIWLGELGIIKIHSLSIFSHHRQRQRLPANWSSCWKPSSIPMVPILILKSKDLNCLLLVLFKTLPVFQLLWAVFLQSDSAWPTHTLAYLSFLSHQHDRAWLVPFSWIFIIINYIY